MTLTVKIKLLPTPEQKALLEQTMKEYIRTVNDVLTQMIDYDQHYRFSSKMIEADIPSCLKSEVAGDALSKDREMFKKKRPQPVFKKPQAVWNNQNFHVEADIIRFPVFRGGKSRQIKVKAIIPEEVFSLLQSSKLGTMRITKKSSKFVAQVAYERNTEALNENTGVMGVDLGVKCPAVSFADGKVRFFGNGRQNKYIRRHYAAKRKKLQKQKKLNAVRKLENKEQRVMTDIDHKLSRKIVDHAFQNGIKTIKLEALEGIRRTTRQSRKNNRTMHSWSFYRLQQFIKYKASLLGINVVEVNPAYTSQICPNCGKLNKAEDRLYSCECGYHGHRDTVGAINICCA